MGLPLLLVLMASQQLPLSGDEIWPRTIRRYAAPSGPWRTAAPSRKGVVLVAEGAARRFITPVSLLRKFSLLVKCRWRACLLTRREQ